MWKSPHKMEDVNCSMTMSTQPQDYWSLKTDIINLCDSTLLPHHQPITVYELITDPLTSHHPYLALCFAETFWGGQGFLRHKPPISLHSPAINLSLLQTLTFWCVWPHCALGTQICTNNFWVVRFYELLRIKGEKWHFSGWLLEFSIGTLLRKMIKV